MDGMNDEKSQMLAKIGKQHWLGGNYSRRFAQI
jgi:hypothetical protein